MKQLLTILFVASSIATFAQAPQGINYQAVIRDNGGAILANQAVGIKMAILQGSPAGTAVYEESFSPTTSQFGLVNVVIGQGTVISGDFTTIDWSAGPYYAEVSADETGGTNYTLLGTQQLMSVPYALYAETAENVTNDQVDDADSDPNNEIQDISLTGTDLSISGGSTVDLSTVQDGTGTDDQTLTLVGTDLTIESGNTVDLSTIQDGTGTDDQNLTGASLTGTTLQIDIESGTSATVDLAGLQDGTGTDDQTLTLTGTDLSIESGNTVDLSTIQDGTGTDDQTLSLAGNTLGIESGNSVDLSGYLDNTDAQTLSLSGSDLSISGGNTITLPGDNDWTVNGSDIHNANAGNVGIGTATPAGILDVSSTTSGVIMPRMTAVQRDAIATPVNGMMVYNTDEDCMNVYQAGAWQSLCGGSGGGSGSNQDTLIYTTDGF
jgi:hypothetical protein